MKKIEGGVTAPKGFKAAGLAAGIKEGGMDLAGIVSVSPCQWAGTFTTNIVRAACVERNAALLTKGQPVRGVVINSGNANACTGEQGKADNEEMAALLANHLQLSPDEILTAATGVIGVPYRMAPVRKGIETLSAQMQDSLDYGALAATAIMTTDTIRKEAAVSFTLQGKAVTIGAMAKGSGMIHPNMATMLSFVTTDVQMSQPLLQKALKTTVDKSYNMISVDRDTSTNDMCIILANGESGAVIAEEGPDYEIFVAALYEVQEQLAKMIAKDGEGATKLMTVALSGAKTEQQAKTIVKSVLSSNLLKCALFGEDANWGRALCAMGYSGEQFDITGVGMRFVSANGAVTVMEKGAPVPFDEETAKKVLSADEITIDLTLKEGTAKAVGWGCDFSYDYVKINGDYRS